MNYAHQRKRVENICDRLGEMNKGAPDAEVGDLMEEVVSLVGHLTVDMAESLSKIAKHTGRIS